MKILRTLVTMAIALRAWGQPAGSPEFEAVEVRVAAALPAGTEVHFTKNGAGKLAQVRMNAGSGLPQATLVFGTNGRVVLEAATMRELMEAAYPEVIGPEYLAGPRWIDTDRFDLIAKAPAKTPVEVERQMIQAALAQRFQLQAHPEEKPMPVYALVAGKHGSKLSPAAGAGDPAGCRPHDMLGAKSDGGIHYSCHYVTMTELAEWLPRRAAGQVDLPVVDLTGLTGAYDFPLDWTGGGDMPGGVTIFGAVERMGPKLERRKHPMRTIVIDRVERTPN